jgi:hypothetical protein
MIVHKRLLLAGVVLVTGILTLLAVPFLGRGDAISHENQVLTVRYLLGLYLPLLGLITAFHFGSLATGGPTKSRSPRSDGRFLIALVLVGFWCLAPAILFAITLKVDATTDLLTELKPFGDTLVLAALGFYFNGAASNRNK